MSTYAQRAKKRTTNGARPHHGDLRAWIAQSNQDRCCQACDGPIRRGDIYVERLVPTTRLWAPIHHFCLS